MQRIGVFVCHCGSNIAATVDVKKVVELAAKEPGVVHAEDYQYMCSEAGQAKIQEAIKEKNLTGVVVCSCSPRMHEATFRKAAERAGLNPYMVEIANIREHCSWIHKDMEEATKKAVILARAAIAKVNLNTPLQPGESRVTKRALIIGGGMAYTFLKAKGLEVGASLVDDTKLDYCKEMIAKAETLGKKLLLPVDTAIAKSFPNPIDAEIPAEYVDCDAIPADVLGLDIGPKTAEIYAEAAKTAKTVVWNGPMGVFENPVLAKGTIAVAKALAETDATTIIGGGDSAAAVNQLGFGDKMSHISTGGGASLEFLEGKELPGVAAANDK